MTSTAADIIDVEADTGVGDLNPVDAFLVKLIDVPEAFARLVPKNIAVALEPLVLYIAVNVGRAFLRERGSSFAGVAEPLIGSWQYNQTVLAEGRQLVIDVVQQVQNSADSIFSPCHLIITALQDEVRQLRQLTGGVTSAKGLTALPSGLFLISSIGILQSLIFPSLNSWWSLTSVAFLAGLTACRLTQKVTSPEILWNELMFGSRRAVFWTLLDERIAAYMQKREILRPVVGASDWDWLLSQLQTRAAQELPVYAHFAYNTTRDDLQLYQLLRERVQFLSLMAWRRVRQVLSRARA